MKRVTLKFLANEVAEWMMRVEIKFESVECLKMNPRNYELERGACRYIVRVYFGGNKTPMEVLVFESMSEIKQRLNDGCRLKIEEGLHYYEMWTSKI